MWRVVLLLCFSANIVSAQTLEWKWGKSGAGSASESGRAITFDYKRNYVYVTGTFSSPMINFGSQQLTNSSSGGSKRDIFIAKYDTAGNLIWANRYGGVQNDYVNAIECDTASGAIYICGQYEVSTQFGSTTLTTSSPIGSAQDFFLCKIDSAGIVEWIKTGRNRTGVPSTPEYGVGLGVMGNGDVVMIGIYSGNLSFCDTLTIDNIKLGYSCASGVRGDRLSLRVTSSGTVTSASLGGGSLLYQLINQHGDPNKFYTIKNDRKGNLYVAYNHPGRNPIDYTGCQPNQVNLGNQPYNTFTILKYNTDGSVQEICAPSGPRLNCGVSLLSSTKMLSLGLDINGNIFYVFDYQKEERNGINGSCMQSGKGFGRINPTCPTCFPGDDVIYDNPNFTFNPNEKITARNNLVYFSSADRIRTFDFELRTQVASITTPINYEAATGMATRQRLFFTGSPTGSLPFPMGPDIITPVAGSDMVVGALEPGCSTAAPNVTTSGSLSFCPGQNVAPQLTAPSGFDYLWSNGETTQTIAPIVSGNYTVTVSNPGCPPVTSGITTITVLSPAAPVITANGPTTFCQGGSVVLTGPPGYTYQWSNGGTTQSIAVTSSGSYTLKIADLAMSSCYSFSSLPIVVTVNSTPLAVITPGGPTTFCQGGSVTLIASAPGLNYLWSTGETTRSIVVSTSGSYTVTYSSPVGCGTPTTSAATVVTVNPLPAIPIITASGPTTFCQGGSVTLSAPAGFTYLWGNGATTQSINVTSSGSHSVTVRNANNCSSTSAPIIVTVNPLPATPTITTSGPTTFCQGGSVTLSAPAGFNYLWSNGATTQSINVNASGNYSVTIFNVNNCNATSVVTTVTVNSLPAIPTITPSGPTTFCQGGSVTLTASAGFSYLWSNGATTQSINVNVSGNYSVTVTNANGCSATSAATSVTVNPLPAVPVITTSGPITFCQGAAVTLSAPAGFTYLWNNGVIAQSINVSTSGNYSVIVTNGSGCTSTSAATTITVNILPAIPIITASGPTTFCLGGSVTLTAPAGFSYLWSNGATTQSINVNTSGNYSVIVTNANNCSATSAATSVTVNPLPTATITASGPITFCQGGAVTLTAPAGFTYLWSNGATTQSININSSGNYSVTVTNVNNCSTTSSATIVTVNPLPSAVITANGATTFCQGGSVTLSAPAGFTYLWSNGATTQSINVTVSGSYSVIVTNANNCSTTSSATIVTVNPLPSVVITASGATTFCQGGSVTLSAPAGLSYLWSNGATSQNINVNTSGSYSVIVTNANNCSATSAATTVTVNPLPAVPVITASGATTFCQGGSVTLSAPSGFTYLWSNGAITQNIAINTTGNYSVTVSNANGCSSTSAATTVTVNPLPPIPTITKVGNTLFSSSPTGNQWYVDGVIIQGATGSSYTYTVGGEFSVTVTNASGCSATSLPITANRSAVVPINATDNFYYTLFPNPVQSQLTIQYDLERSHQVGVSLIDINGHTITVQRPVMQQAGSYSLNANSIAERLWKGMYILQFTIDGKKVTHKIMKL